MKQYQTSFPATENPISESGAWVNGLATGLDWKNVRTTPGLAFGTQAGTGSPPYDDSVAVVAPGTWDPNHASQGTIYSGNGGTDANAEVELWLRMAVGANSITGYECNYNTKTANPYFEIVRWNGALNDFSPMLHIVGTPVVTGDIYTASIYGDVITLRLNGTVIAQKNINTDINGDPLAKLTTGSPGVGFFLRNLTGTRANSDYGWSAFLASDLDKFGNLNTGASPLDNVSNNAIWIKAATPTVSGKLLSVRVYCKIKSSTGGTPTLCAGLFSDNAGAPGTDLGHNYTGVLVPAGLDYIDIPISGDVAIVSGTQYWLGMFIPAGGGGKDVDVYFTDPGAVTELYYKDNGVPGGTTFPTTSGMSSVQHENMAIFASIRPDIDAPPPPPDPPPAIPRKRGDMGAILAGVTR